MASAGRAEGSWAPRHGWEEPEAEREQEEVRVRRQRKSMSRPWKMGTEQREARSEIELCTNKIRALQGMKTRECPGRAPACETWSRASTYRRWTH
jgi:hypothetical protein